MTKHLDYALNYLNEEMSKIENIKFEEQCHCGYEAAELLMAACEEDSVKAAEILNEHQAKADPSLRDFYLNAFDGLSAVMERRK